MAWTTSRFYRKCVSWNQNIGCCLWIVLINRNLVGAQIINHNMFFIRRNNYLMHMRFVLTFSIYTFPSMLNYLQNIC